MTTTSTTVDPRSLREMLDSSTPPRVLDVRHPGEFDTAHIPHSPELIPGRLGRISIG